MSTNVTSNVGASPQILRGTPVGGEDIQHIVLVDPTGTVPAVTNGTIAANAAAVGMDVQSMGAAVLQVTGTWAGTLQFEGRPHISGSYFPLRVRDLSGNEVTSTTTNGTFFANVAGLERVRVISSAWTSGTATAYLRVEQGAPGAITQLVKSRQPASYSAHYRLAARPYPLSFAMTANSRKQYATLFHTAASTKALRVRRARVAVRSISAAAIVTVDLVRLTAATTPATGNPAITPTGHASSDPTAEATALALPTTAGTEQTGSVLHHVVYETAAVTGAVTTTAPPTMTTPWQSLYADDSTSVEDVLMIPAGVAGGFAVVFDSNAAATVTGFVELDFSEE